MDLVYTATTAKRRFGEVLKKALLQPVQIRRNGRIVAVITSAPVALSDSTASPSWIDEWVNRPEKSVDALKEERIADPRLDAVLTKYERAA